MIAPTGNRFFALPFVLISGMILLAGPALADDVAGLAPPGPCAKAREAVSGSGLSTFSIVGPVQALLSPIDVAAGPPPLPVQPPPTPRGPDRPGPCDEPGSGCGLGLTNAPVVNPPIVPGGGPPIGQP